MIYLTSDLHIGHVRCAEWRGFANVDEMNRTLVENWNDTVKDDDIVVVLGDVAMGTIADSLPIVSTLRGRKHLVAGNHDRMHPTYHHSGTAETVARKRAEWTQRYHDAGFAEIVLNQVTVDFLVDHDTALQQFTLCHFPRSGDHTDEERFTEHRPADNGNWLLHGHLHGAFGQVSGERQIDVGVDAWGWTPVSVETLTALVTEGTNA